MRYADAKKLHNEDEVICKKTNESLYVIETEDDTKHRAVYALLSNGLWYHHRTLK